MRLALESARGNPIENEQSGDALEAAAVAALDAKWAGHRGARCAPTGRYNCHGMTFAGRRTGIWEPLVVRQILADDGYEEVRPSEVMPGDIILYFTANGDVEHSGVVLELPSFLGYPLVCSKWGCFRELVHWAHQCPYSLESIKYYRIRSC